MGVMTMTKAEREAFVAEARVGVLAVSGADGAAPSLTPIWYTYEPGGAVVMETSGTSPKTALLRATGTASLCVHTETPPYKYVVVEGPVAIDDALDETWRRGLARRYLGDELGDMYADATKEQAAGAVTIRLTPTRWHTTDFAKQWG
jgi:PPOX class probable F420-dependent enzyme